MDYVSMCLAGKWQHFEGMYCFHLQGRGLVAKAFFETTYAMYA